MNINWDAFCKAGLQWRSVSLNSLPKKATARLHSSLVLETRWWWEISPCVRVWPARLLASGLRDHSTFPFLPSVSVHNLGTRLDMMTSCRLQHCAQCTESEWWVLKLSLFGEFNTVHQNNSFQYLTVCTQKWFHCYYTQITQSSLRGTVSEVLIVPSCEACSVLYNGTHLRECALVHFSNRTVCTKCPEGCTL